MAIMKTYCPGFNLYDVTFEGGDVVRVAGDNQDNASFVARINRREDKVTSVTYVSTNPAADEWKAEADR